MGTDDSQSKIVSVCGMAINDDESGDSEPSVDSGLAIEFHYDDGDVGVHPAGKREQDLWQDFAAGHRPSHIVIRTDDDKGQALSDALHGRLEHMKDGLSEDELAAYFQSRIEDGDLDLEDIPRLMARYALMDPAEFVDEMHERMEMTEDNQE